MSEITKMYENAGILKKRECEYSNGICERTDFIPCELCSIRKDMDYPPFTANKQILLLQWLLDRADLYLHRHKTDFTYSIASGDIAANKCKKFKESIAEFINTIWQDLTEEEEKQQVKGILE